MIWRCLTFAAALAVTSAPSVAAQSTAGMPLSADVVRSLAVYAMNSLSFGSVGSSNLDQTLTVQPSSQGAGFMIVGELNRTVAITCPATATLIDAAQGGTGITFTPRFALFTPLGVQSSYVRGAGGCPSVVLQPSGTEGQVYLAIGGDLVIPKLLAGAFRGVYTISVAYP